MDGTGLAIRLGLTVLELYGGGADSVNPYSPRLQPLLYKHAMTRSKRPPDFEKSLSELEALVERLEGGELPLEESLKAFERGVALTRECQVALEAAQARVDILLKRDGAIEAQPFPDEGDDDAGSGEDRLG